VNKISFVSPYRDLTAAVRKIAEEMGIGLDIVEGIMTEDGWMGAEGARPETLSLGDIVVSRGGTAYHLARAYKLPVVTIDPGPFDLLECCREAKRYSENIALTYFQRPVGLDLIADVLGITITPLTIKTIRELETRIELLSREGNYCVVGGGPSTLYAQKYGVPNVFLRTSPDSIREALKRADELASLHQEVKRRANRLETILGCSYEGVIAVDSSGDIDIFNKAAERILGITAQSAMGKKAAEVIPGSRLVEVLENGQAQLNQVQSVHGVRIVTNRQAILDGDDIAGAVATFQEESSIRQIEHKLRKESTEGQFRAKLTLEDILGQSEVIKQKKDLARKFASSDLTVFINGFSGTGKELFAQGIHNASRRAKGPFVAINCGALPQSLLESELFGYAEGAFTGAKRSGKAGLFELAHNGSIFLDEIDAMPLDMQGRLLRVLQEREVLRVGAEGIIPVDIRVIAASNKPPKTLLEQKLIREDLYYRLNVLYLEIPPLRERKEDIPLLCAHFLPEKKRESAANLIADMMPYLQKYPWPGNVRELLNFIQRLTFFLDERLAGEDPHSLLAVIAPDLLPAIEPERTACEDDFRAKIASQEEALIEEAIKECGNLAEAAEKLGLPKTTLWRKLRKMKERE